MHVEVNVALNFLVSYLYNKLPRRRVDLFREELEKGLKEKFEGHWYPDKPFKGSGYRCVRCNGEKVDPVILVAAHSAGLDVLEMKEHIPQEMSLWIDPSEVSYRLSERSPIKVLYTEEEDEEVCGNVDEEVQVANHTFNPEASSFQPIDSLSSSLASADFHLSFSASPVSPSMWSSSTTMPQSTLFSPPQSLQSTPPASLAMQQSPVPMYMSKTSCAAAPQFTAASFAATKFGSTKLKSQAKRPTRLSPTEMGNFFRQQQHLGFSHMTPAPQRPRSLSPRDPRVEFMMDQQQRFNSCGQVSPQGQQPSLGHALNQHHLVFPPSPLSPDTSMAADLMRHTPSPHLPPYMGTAASTFPEMLSPGSRSSGSLSSIQSPVSSLSPEGNRSFMEDLQQFHNMHSFPGHLQHLLVAN